MFILADDMGYGDFSAFNGGLSSTPNLDALMRESLCFSQHYTASPVCNPSRACLLTGRYPHRTGSIDTLEWWGLERLALRETTLADVLKSAGYSTGLAGKWHLGAFDIRYHPMRRGFDEAVCFRGGMHDYYSWRIEYGYAVKRADGRYLTDVWTECAVDFLKRHVRKQPFFLHVTYNAPHDPLQAPQEEIDLFAGKPGLNHAVATIYAMIHRMDAGVGRILETLDQLGLRDNTIVMFSSDNGPQFGGDGEWRTDRFNCNFRGAKGFVYEGGIRVPMIMRWPDGVDGNGREITDMVHFADWFPTLLEAARVPLRSDLKLDGISILPILRGERRGTYPQRCWQWNRYEPVITTNAAIREGDWKLVRPCLPGSWYVPDIHWLQTSMYEPEYFIERGIFRPPYPQRDFGPPPQPELYNVADDPGETRNMATEHPEIAAKLLRKLETWFYEVEAERRSIND